MAFVRDPDDDQNALPFVGADIEVDAVGPDINVVLLP